MPHLRRSNINKRYCARCYAHCEPTHEFQNCTACNRFYHNHCLLKSRKYTSKILRETKIFYCSNKCVCSVFPFHLVREKEFAKINSIDIKQPCTKCGGECNRFDTIQCDVCDKWTHFVCTTLTRREFVKLGESSEMCICSDKCQMRVLPFHGQPKRGISDFFNVNNETAHFSSAQKEVIISCETKSTNSVDEDEPNTICNYIDPDETHELGLGHGSKDLFLFHCNVASLNKNQEKIEELFRDSQKLPDIIGVTETK